MSSGITRRDALKIGIAAAIAPAVLTRNAQAQERNVDEVSMGFIGVGARGTVLLSEVLAHAEVQVPAVCDIDEKNLNRALDLVEKARGKRPEGYLKGPQDYQRLLSRDDINCVLIATPQELHAKMTLDAFAAGKFVGCEVPACCTIDECWTIVRGQRKSGVGYMMLENYIYPQPQMQVWNMARAGVFGDLTYGAGAYIHEIRSMRFDATGKLTWRGENVLHARGIVYPTHAIGPVCRWMDINVTDKLKTLVCVDSKPASNRAYAEKKFGKESVQAKLDWENGDTSQALIRTEKGRLIEVRYDTASPRPAGMGQFSLQGTGGAFESALGERMVWLEGRSPQEKWEPLEKYRREFEHPMWKQLGDDAKSTGHGGGDYFVIREFIEAVKTGKSPIDVVDAATWSCIRPLSAESIRKGFAPVEVPAFA